MGGQDGGKGGQKRQAAGGGAGRRCAFKVFCPDLLMKSLLGYGKEALERETNCKVKMGSERDYYPGSRLRALVAYETTPEGLLPMLELIIQRIVELGQLELSTGSPVHDGETFLGKEQGEYLFRAAIPVKIFGGLIGHGGSNIQKLRNEHGAKVFIDNDKHNGHQFVRIIGPERALHSALRSINEIIQKEGDGQDWFMEWAQAFAGSEGDHAMGVGGNVGRNEGRGQERERSPRRVSNVASALEADGEERPVEPDQENDELDVEAGRVMSEILAETPHEALAAQQCVTCMLPRDKVSALIGPGGSHVKMVRRVSGASLRFEDPLPDAGEDAQQTLVLKGSPLEIYIAHALMMKKYHEEEIAPSRKPAKQEAASLQAHSGGSPDVAALERQLQELQKQLAAAQAVSGKQGKGKKGKGGKGK